MVNVLDKDGSPLAPTDRNGKVRRMLKEGKAKVVSSDPFTIQLTDSSVEDTKMDIKTKNGKSAHHVTIVSNSKVPPELDGPDVQKLRVDEFVEQACSDTGCEYGDIIYFNIDDLNKGLYEGIMDAKKILDAEVRFFRDAHNFKSYVTEPILVCNGNAPKNQTIDPDILNSYKVNYARTIPSCATLLILNQQQYCLETREKILSIKKDRGFSIVNIHANNAVETLPALQKQMMTRFKIMEREQVNNVFKVTHVYGDELNPICVVIYVNELLDIKNYRDLDTIKQSLGSMARLGRAAGFNLVFIVNDDQAKYGTILSTDLLNNISCTITLGPICGSLERMVEPEHRVNTPDDCITVHSGNEVLVCRFNEIA